MIIPREECSLGSWFCNPLDSSKPVTRTDAFLGSYTDADLAAYLNALSFGERQRVEEDIHGVADVTEETFDYVSAKIEEMQQALSRLSPQQRQAWDRAVFLRPAFAEDPKFHLMFLRAHRFRHDDAAVLLQHTFEQNEIFGEMIY